MTPRFAAPNVFGAMMQGEQFERDNNMRDLQASRQNALADLGFQRQAFAEKTDARDYEFRVEGRDFQREQQRIAAQRAAAARAQAARANASEEERRMAGIRLQEAFRLPAGERFGYLQQFMEPEDIAPFMNGPEAAPVLDDQTMRSLYIEAVRDLPPEAEPYSPQSPEGKRFVDQQNLPGMPAPEEKSPIAALEARAAAAGYVPGSPEYMAFMAEGGAPDPGMEIGTNPDGSFFYRQGPGAGGGSPKLTEAQSKDVNYVTRMQSAGPILDGLDTQLTSLRGNLLEEVPLGNYLQSPDYQKARQAGLEWTAAVLRKDSGAALTATDIEYADRIWLPQPGDGAPVIAQKRRARETAEQGLLAGLGPAQIMVPPPATPDGPKRLRFNPMTGEIE